MIAGSITLNVWKGAWKIAREIARKNVRGNFSLRSRKGDVLGIPTWVIIVIVVVVVGALIAAAALLGVGGKAKFLALGLQDWLANFFGAIGGK